LSSSLPFDPSFFAELCKTTDLDKFFEGKKQRKEEIAWIWRVKTSKKIAQGKTPATQIAW
jgi:hypothetical protein